jgi:galactose-1-phosphate uridylyltransferase
MITLEEVIRALPPELQQEVEAFARFLLERRTQKYGRKLRQDWAGALREYSDQYTSVELQHKISDLRIEDLGEMKSKVAMCGARRIWTM